MSDGKKFDIVQYDAAMADNLVDDRDVEWHDPHESAFRLSGLPFSAPGGAFRRLPIVPENSIPEAVDMLAWHTSGAMLAFRTDSEKILLRVRLRRKQIMDHMTSVGSAGFDLYMGPPENRVFVAVTRFPAQRIEYAVMLFRHPAGPGMREYLLDFPLYAGVEKLEIGFAPGSRVAPPSPWSYARKVVFYGTSITQGGCASRPGMSLANILSRRWNMEVVNLGFSGNGKGEPEVLELVAGVPDPALFVLDYVINAGLECFRRTLPGAIDIIRRHHPAVDVALLTPTHLCRELTNAARAAEFDEICAFMRAEVARRNASGDEHVHYVNGTIDAPDWYECTVDGSHLTDLGFRMQSELVAPQLEKLL